MALEGHRYLQERAQKNSQISLQAFEFTKLKDHIIWSELLVH